MVFQYFVLVRHINFQSVYGNVVKYDPISLKKEILKLHVSQKLFRSNREFTVHGELTFCCCPDVNLGLRSGNVY